MTARQANRVRFWPRRGDFEGSQRTQIPDLDRPVVRSGHDLGPIRGKRHRPDGVAVGVGLLRYTVDERRDHPANKREEERLIGCMRAFGSMEIWGHKAAASLKGVCRVSALTCTAYSVPQG